MLKWLLFFLHRNMSSSGFWLVYNSFKTDEECKGLRTELTKEGFEYTLPSDVFQRHSSCEFTMASNLSLGERVRFRVLHSESDVTLRSVEYDEAGHSKIHPLLDNGDWRPYKWVYSRYPLALTLKRSAYTRNGASSFSFEVIDTPGCDGSEITVEVDTDSLDFNSADYPQQYQGSEIFEIPNDLLI
ncbi:uncharacterized protein LOC101862303 [Aplysia californica]|uniref:Uncharacterized protein LOC101862303 n=1 Tax=Aplysia californica TaxID=6500 RepID=A0ABM0K4U6_APLCA|nr:uncharacterized protein LOC101862303 [Aplysia californica]